MGRIGILGGTFDPPHIGHLVLAEYAADALDLDCVLFAPAADPPHKRDSQRRVTVEHRVAMTQAAIRHNPRLSLSRVDLDRPGPHYTVDMLKLLHLQYPDDALYFLMGGDSFRNLPTWHQPRELIQLARLVVMRRPGANRVDWEFNVDLYETIIPGISQCVDVIEAPLMDVSSTGILERLRANKTVRYLVPDQVLDYIAAHHLYSLNEAEP